MFRPISYISIAQGLYYLAIGIRRLAGSPGFQAMSGGLLVIVIGGVLVFAGIRRKAGAEVLALAVGSAAALSALEIAYVVEGQISPAYLLAVLVQIVLLALWILVWMRGARERRAVHSVPGFESHK